MVVSVAESNFLLGSSEMLSTNLAKIRDFSQFFSISELNFLSLFLHFTVKKCLKEIKFKFSSQYCDSEMTFNFSFFFYAHWRMCVGSVALLKTHDVAQLFFFCFFFFS